MERFQIGTLTIKKDTVFTDRGYECAAWYENILVKAGRYPIFAERCSEHDDGLIFCNIVARLPGTITTDYFGSMFCGNPVGTYDEKKNAGKPSEYFWMIHDFTFGEYVYTGHEDDTFSYEIDPAYEVRPHEYEDSYYHKTATTYWLYRRAV